MIDTIFYLLGTCVPPALLALGLGFIATGNEARLAGYKPNTDRIIVRRLFESSGKFPVGVQLVYGIILFLSFWVMAFMLLMPMLLISSPPQNMISAYVIFLPFIIGPIAVYIGYRVGVRKCVNLIKKYT
ncbi:hypothetical protein [Simiduia agarivorans]|uniref:hypothetical protein n=1 Tax=Simiduia agarivorans TaxID=447471 RepID=UPI0012DD0FC7|nr:hypothetical protein [Simiduia agarivorans]